jgi:hypothetical protein
MRQKTKSHRRLTLNPLCRFTIRLEVCVPEAAAWGGSLSTAASPTLDGQGGPRNDETTSQKAVKAKFAEPPLGVLPRTRERFARSRTPIHNHHDLPRSYHYHAGTREHPSVEPII